VRGRRRLIATTRVLAAAGVPVPPTCVKLDPGRLAPLLAGGPLIVKPYRGSQGRGVHVVATAEALGRVPIGDPVMAQRYLPPDGPDHKIYRIGGDCFCVQRSWPPRTYADKLGEPAELDAELLGLTYRCGAALGIDLYGVDVIYSGGPALRRRPVQLPGLQGRPGCRRPPGGVHLRRRPRQPARPAGVMRIAFLLTRRVPPVPSPVLREVFALLERRGHAVEAGIPEERLARADTLELAADLYVLKSHTELALSLAGVLHDRGAALLNPYAGCLAAQDKITAVRRLRASGVPAPATWVTGDLRLAAPLLDDGPLVVKPHRGHRGAGVHVVRTPAQLAALPTPPVPVVVQRYVPGPGEDLKVYVVADEVFAVRKPFTADSFTRAGRPAPVPGAVREIAARTRAAFGLDLFGLDLIESPAGPVVVDVNYFPGYKGVPGVAPRIAEVVAAYAHAEARPIPDGAAVGS